VRSLPCISRWPGDLRLITAAMKITTELERIGDRVVDICNGVHQRGGEDPIESAYRHLSTRSTCSRDDSR
jgi:phosphate uptake regulator